MEISQAGPHDSARAFGERFFVEPRFGKRRRTLCTSSFPNRWIGEKDPAKAEAAIMRYSHNKKTPLLPEKRTTRNKTGPFIPASGRAKPTDRSPGPKQIPMQRADRTFCAPPFVKSDIQYRGKLRLCQPCRPKYFGKHRVISRERSARAFLPRQGLKRAECFVYPQGEKPPTAAQYLKLFEPIDQRKKIRRRPKLQLCAVAPEVFPCRFAAFVV